MVWDSNNLQTRQFERRDTRLSARIEVGEDQTAQLRFSFTDSQNRITVIDVSEGGLGLQTGVFLPKNARLLVRIRSDDEQSARDYSVHAVVRRCIMTDFKPTYQVGLQFLDAAVVDVKALVQLAKGTTVKGDTTQPEAPHAG